MTTPDLSSVQNALDAYAAAVQAELVGDHDTIAGLQGQLGSLQTEVSTLQANVTTLQGQLATANQTIATLQAELNALQNPPSSESKVLFGSGIGGWFQSLSEKKPDAYARITKTLVGDGNYLPVIRLFASSVPSYIDPRCKIFLDTGNSASAQQIATLGQRGPGQFLSVIHEPENKTSIASWQTVQKQHASLVKANGGGNVSLVPLLMGQSFIPSRNPKYPAAAWFDFDLTGIDYIGADLYQQGKSDADADTVAEFIQPAIDLARSLGKKLVVGELGFRRVNPPYTPGISDAKRAQTIKDAIALCNANADIVAAVMLFESDNGASNMVPWPITHPTNPKFSPLAVAAWVSAYAE